MAVEVIDLSPAILLFCYYENWRNTEGRHLSITVNTEVVSKMSLDTSKKDGT